MVWKNALHCYFFLFHIMHPSIIGQNNGELDLRCY